MSYYIYILECSNNAYYTGYTTDIVRRYQEHLSGSGKCKYTRSFPPKHLAVYWKLSCDLSVVLKIERVIKSLPKIKKTAVINHPEILIDILESKGHCQSITLQMKVVSRSL